MTDWHIVHLLGPDKKEEQKEITSYDELFFWAWSQWGYTDSQIKEIWHWHDIEKLTDEQIKVRLGELGWLQI